MWYALQTLFLSSDSDVMRVVGQGPPGADFIEILIEAGPLRQSMVRFSRNILLLSLVISVITAALVYLSLLYLFVRPMNRLTAKANSSKTAGRPDALALMDAAYVTEALRQITLIGGVTGYKDQVEGIRGVLRGHDGVQYINASLAAKPDDAGLEFAAALIASDKDRAAYLRHAERARAGASQDALVARNLKHIS